MDLEHGAIYKDNVSGWVGKCLLPEANRRGNTQPDLETRVDLIGKGPKGSAESRAITDRNELELIATADEIADPNYIPSQTVEA